MKATSRNLGAIAAILPRPLQLLEEYLERRDPISRLPRDFFLSDDVVLVAQQLIGKIVWSRDTASGVCTGGIIVETEAYRAPGDRASHAYNFKKTKRNKSMYCVGGTSYVFVCYGRNLMFNVVTGPADTPHAVLIRAVEPIFGISHICSRRGASKFSASVGSGPGCLTASLGITRQDDGVDLVRSDRIWLSMGLDVDDFEAFLDTNYPSEKADVIRFSDTMLWRATAPSDPPVVISTPRIGVDYAKEDAQLPWRFVIRQHPSVSRQSLYSDTRRRKAPNALRSSVKKRKITETED